MKKLTIMLVLGLCLMAPVMTNAAEKNAAAAGLLSAVMPGTGEWYNSNWNGAFPWGECIVGNICFCFHFSSIMDAVGGDTSNALRLDFWSSPAPTR